MRKRNNMLIAGRRIRGRLWPLIAHTWEILPQERFHHLGARERGLQ
jgi:hypothetical protein